MAQLNRAINDLESAIEWGDVPNAFIDAALRFMAFEEPFTCRIDRSGDLTKGSTVVVRLQPTDRFYALLSAIRARDFNFSIFETPSAAEHVSPA